MFRQSATVAPLRPITVEETLEIEDARWTFAQNLMLVENGDAEDSGQDDLNNIQSSANTNTYVDDQPIIGTVQYIAPRGGGGGSYSE